MMAGQADEEFKDAEDSENASSDDELVALVDTACTRCMHGRRWRRRLERLLAKAGRRVKVTAGQRSFKFAGDAEAKTNVVVEFPIGIKGHEGMIRSPEVGEHTPLLLSIGALKALGMKMDLERHPNHVYFGKIQAWVPLIKTKTGHLGIRIDQFADRNMMALA